MAKKIEARALKQLKLDALVSYSAHPFKLYDDQRMSDMVKSVEENGVIIPIIVRPTNDGKYEILSGHNRVEAARRAGLPTIQAIVRDDLTDEEANLIVTETNLIQRSFKDLRHSERAVALANHYEALLKRPGYRAELLSQIAEMTAEDSSPLVNGSIRTIAHVGEQYGLSKETMYRYIKINKLNEKLKLMLDENDLPIRTAVSLSYLRPAEQDAVANIADTVQLSMHSAELLRRASAERVASGGIELSESEIKEILQKNALQTTTKPLRISSTIISRHFTAGQSQSEMEDIINKALAKWFEEN